MQKIQAIPLGKALGILEAAMSRGIGMPPLEVRVVVEYLEQALATEASCDCPGCQARRAAEGATKGGCTENPDILKTLFGDGGANDDTDNPDDDKYTRQDGPEETK